MILNITLNRITDYLSLLKVLIVLCLNSKSLYNGLIKLNTMNKKRLIIKIMFLRKSYKKRKFLKYDKLIKTKFNGYLY